MHMFDQATAPQVRHRFEVGLRPRLGDKVYLLPSGVATTIPPTGSNLVLRALHHIGLRRRPIALRLGVVVDCSTYHEDLYCTVLYT